MREAAGARVTKASATLANGDMLSTAYLREPVATLLSAAPRGLGEAMLVHLIRVDEGDAPFYHNMLPAYQVTDDDPWVRKTRQTCKLLGAKRDEHGVWVLPASKRNQRRKSRRVVWDTESVLESMIRWYERTGKWPTADT